MTNSLVDWAPKKPPPVCRNCDDDGHVAFGMMYGPCSMCEAGKRAARDDKRNFDIFRILIVAGLIATAIAMGAVATDGFTQCNHSLACRAVGK